MSPTPTLPSPPPALPLHCSCTSLLSPFLFVVFLLAPLLLHQSHPYPHSTSSLLTLSLPLALLRLASFLFDWSPFFHSFDYSNSFLCTDCVWQVGRLVRCCYPPLSRSLRSSGLSRLTTISGSYNHSFNSLECSCFGHRGICRYRAMRMRMGRDRLGLQQEGSGIRVRIRIRSFRIRGWLQQTCSLGSAKAVGKFPSHMH